MHNNHSHLLLKISGDFSNDKFVYNSFVNACHSANAKVLGTVQHSFFPEGFSAAILLSESHCSIHTWPEYRLAKVDFFSCSPNPGFDLFMSHLKQCGYETVECSTINR